MDEWGLLAFCKRSENLVNKSRNDQILDEWGRQFDMSETQNRIGPSLSYYSKSFSIIFKIMIHWIERRLELAFYCQFTDEKATKRRRKASDSNKYRLETQKKQIVKSRNLVPIMYVLGKAIWYVFVGPAYYLNRWLEFSGSQFTNEKATKLTKSYVK